MQRYFFIVLLISLACCALPRKPNLDEVQKVKSLIEQARIKMSSGEFEQAESIIYLAEEIYPQDVRVLDAKGCLAWHRNRDDLAESLFRNAILLDPSFENSYINLAFVLEQKGNVLQAKALLKKVLEINPLNYKARNNYAGILFDQSLTEAEREISRRELNKAVNSVSELDGVLKYNVDKFN